jgi:hypothetical protein
MSGARGAGALIVAALLLAGCTETVSGHGGPPGASDPSGTSTSEPPSGSGTPSSPAPSSGESSSGAPSGAHLACPRVVDSSAHLAYDCITRVMTKDSDTIWPLKFIRQVDVDWTLDEGSTHVAVTGTANGNVTVLANGFASAMGAQEYGPNAGVTKVRDADVKVAGRTAHLVESVIKLDPDYRAKRHLKVKLERLWVVVLRIGPDQFSAWYVSIPDVRKALWSRVPDLMKRIKVV